MERESNSEVTVPREGIAVGTWVIKKSKSYPNLNYYFNTATGEAVWNLCPEDLAQARRVGTTCKFEKHVEPKSKPPLVNTISGFGQPNINIPYPLGTMTIPAPMNSVNLITTQPQLNPRVWDLGIGQQIFIVPPVSQLNQQPVDIRYGVQHRSNRPTRGHISTNVQGNTNRLRGNRFKNNRLNWHQTRRGKTDLRQRFPANTYFSKNDGINSRPDFKKGFTASSNDEVKEEYNYESEVIEEKEEDCISKLDCAPLKNLAKPMNNMKCWYLVVDADVLLHNFNYLSNLTSTDPDCCFLVPNCVVSKLEHYAVEEKCISARRILRFLADNACTGTEELELDEETKNSSNIIKRIYNVCINLRKQNYHVVLISEDKNLLHFNNIIYVFNIAKVKNMVSDYVSHKQIPSSSTSTSDRVVRTNLKSSDFCRTITNNHVPMSPIQCTKNRTLSFSESHSVRNNLDLDHLSSMLTNIRTRTFSEKNHQQDSDMRVNITDSIDTHIAELQTNKEQQSIDNTEDMSKPSVTGEEDIFCASKQVRKIKLNRTILPAINNTTCNPNVIEAKKFRWRKRRVCASKVDKCLSTADSELKIETTAIIESDRDTAGTKPKDVGNDDHSCIIVKNDTSECVVIDETSSSGIISNTGSNFDSTNTLNMNQGPLKSLQSFRQVKENPLLDNVMFEIRSEAMAENLKTKCDEWVSRFFQIMEDCLSQILRQESVIANVALPPPWNLPEAVQCIIKEFYYNCLIVDAANNLSIISKKISTKPIANILPTEFMEMYSYGVYLVNTLKQVQQNNEDLEIASQSLKGLLDDIENPHMEINQSDIFLDEAALHEEDIEMVSNVSMKKTVQTEIETERNTRPQKYDPRTIKTQISQVESKPSTDAINTIEDVMVTFIGNLPLDNNVDGEKCGTKFSNESVQDKETDEVDVVDDVDMCNYNNTTPRKIVRCFTKVPQFEERLKNCRGAPDDIFKNKDYNSYSVDNEEMADADSAVETLDVNSKDVELFYILLFNYTKNILIQARDFCINYEHDMNEQGQSENKTKRLPYMKKIHTELIKINYLFESLLSRENGKENAQCLLKEDGIVFKIPDDYINIITKLKYEAALISDAFEHLDDLE